MKAFVTGATGFIGGHLARALLRDGYQVRALVRPGSDRRNIAGLPIELVEGDLDDRHKLAEQIAGCDAVFHVAAHYSLWVKDRDSIYRANVDGAKNLLAAARAAKVKRVVHTSSVAAIGIPAPGALGTEETQTTLEELVSDYKKSKYLAEQAALRAAREGLDVVIVNPSTPVGERDVKPTPTGEIILRFLQDRMPAYVRTGLNLIERRRCRAGAHSGLGKRANRRAIHSGRPQSFAQRDARNPRGDHGQTRPANSHSSLHPDRGGLH